MEGERKRKRGENGEVKGRDRRKKEDESVPEREVEAVAPQPSEEEVEEFFTILRRMHVAVKYFEQTGTSIRDVNGDGVNNITALEKDAVGVGDRVKIEEKKSLVLENGGGLDLNAVPEAES